MRNSKLWSSSKGFSLVEVLIVIFIAAILAGIAMPSFLQWRRNLERRTTAQSIANVLRDAKTRSITANKQYRVVFESPGFRRYGFAQGDRSAASTPAGWTPLVWTDVPPSVTLTLVNLSTAATATGSSIDFNPNGTTTLATAAAIGIYGISTAKTYTVNVSTAGRISVQ